MRQDNRLSSVLHVLLHMAHSDRPLTSAELGRFLDTNPVRVRQILGCLRELGYVDTLKGHGGGWSIACDLAQVTLRQVYDAVGAPTVFAMGNRVDAPSCLVEQAVNAALDDAMQAAEAMLIARLDDVTLADLSSDFNARLARRRRRESPSGKERSR